MRRLDQLREDLDDEEIVDTEPLSTAVLGWIGVGLVCLLAAGVIYLVAFGCWRGK